MKTSRRCLRKELAGLSTEKQQVETNSLSSFPTRKILRAINEQDKKVPLAVEHEIPRIASAAEVITQRLKSGGRLYYVGAGTSGRLGVIDAAELFPTFGAGPELVQAIIAGGDGAMFRSVEGAEDSKRDSFVELRRRKLSKNDVVLGISASGRTPFVLAALDYANRRKAKTIALTVNRGSPIFKHASTVICPETGPEVITGSTRMKAGTAVKLVLNMISSTVMVKLGRVHGNLMVGMKPISKKLVERAKRIISLETGLTYEDAGKKLEEASMNLNAAIIMAKLGTSYKESLKILERTHNSLEDALRTDYRK